MARKREVGPARIREWANENGQSVGTRGKFSQELLDAFHAANKGEVYTVGKQEGRKITGIRVNASGRKTPVTVTATIAEVRDWASKNGVTVGSRGRIAPEVLAAFAAAPKA
jgi:hypothetical protein